MSICKFIVEYESHEHDIAMQYVYGPNAFIVLSELDNFLRGRLKYAELPEQTQKEVQAIRNQLWDELRERNIDGYVHV